MKRIRHLAGKTIPVLLFVAVAAWCVFSLRAIALNDQPMMGGPLPRATSSDAPTEAYGQWKDKFCEPGNGAFLSQGELMNCNGSWEMTAE